MIVTCVGWCPVSWTKIDHALCNLLQWVDFGPALDGLAKFSRLYPMRFDVLSCAANWKAVLLMHFVFVIIFFLGSYLLACRFRV
jgi:hypothetical protein